MATARCYIDAMSYTNLDHHDKNGRIPQVGDIVRWGDAEGEVLIVEGPCPGSRSTAEGKGTLLVAGFGPSGSNGVIRAEQVEVV